jgi:hypothetical protein
MMPPASRAKSRRLDNGPSNLTSGHDPRSYTTPRGTIDREVKAAQSKGERTDFRIAMALGLQLRISASGTKSWALGYKSPATGKWAKIVLGRARARR